MIVYQRRPLRKGDRIRIDPESPARTVLRTTPCAAYLGGEPHEVTLPDGRTFTSHGAVTAIALYSFVFPEGESEA